MYISHQTETPHGAVANAHRIYNVIVEGTTVVKITINSFASETSELLVWQDQHEMPMALFSQGSYPDNVLDFLTGPNGFFSGGTVVDDLTALEESKVKMMAQINAMRDKKISNGCITPSGGVDTDEVALRNIMGAYQSAVLAKLANEPFSTEWRLVDNSMETLDADKMIAMGNAVLAHTRGCYENSWRLKAEVENALTIEEVNAILIGLGWPR